MNGHRHQHVIEEADAGAHGVLSAPVQVKGHAYVRLARLPLNCRYTFAHCLTLLNQVTDEEK